MSERTGPPPVSKSYQEFMQFIPIRDSNQVNVATRTDKSELPDDEFAIDFPNPADAYNTVKEAVYDFDLTLAGKLGINTPWGGGDGDEKYHSHIYVHEFYKGKTLDSKNKKFRMRWGSAARIYVKATVNDTSAKVNALALITASVTMSLASAEAYIELIGVKNSQKIKTPTAPRLTIEDYAKWDTVYADLRAILDSPEIEWSPEILAISPASPLPTTPDKWEDEVESSVAVCLALSKLSQGKTLKTALETQIKTNKWLRVQDVSAMKIKVESIYGKFHLGANDPPSPADIWNAKNLLRGRHMSAFKTFGL